MTRSRIALTATTIAATLIAAAPAGAFTKQPARISAANARMAAQMVFANYAGALDQKLVITPCKPKGKRSRVCIVRVGSDRYKLIAHLDASGENIVAAAQKATR